MEELLEALAPSDTALDLGCGPGSFDYSRYLFRVVGIDIHLDAANLFRDDLRLQYIQSRAEEIPLQDGSVDLVFCHHTLEHFPDYKRTLSEIGRVLSPKGLLWIAVPDGYSFDDLLFRHIFSGGGHVNQFRRVQLSRDVSALTGTTLIQWVKLHSGFVYLKSPTPT